MCVVCVHDVCGNWQHLDMSTLNVLIHYLQDRLDA
jgi:hypothetical protein